MAGMDPAIAGESALIPGMEWAVMDELHYKGGEAAALAFAAVDGGRMGLVDADLTLASVGLSVVRIWARWLKGGGMAQAGQGYLLNQMIRRPGWVRRDKSGQVQVAVKPGALDIVMQLAGYLEPLERVSWLKNANICFVDWVEKK
jgi:hypothetical protein